jgi:hypothetical protein
VGGIEREFADKTYVIAQTRPLRGHAHSTKLNVNKRSIVRNDCVSSRVHGTEQFVRMADRRIQTNEMQSAGGGGEKDTPLHAI